MLDVCRSYDFAVNKGDPSNRVHLAMGIVCWMFAAAMTLLPTRVILPTEFIKLSKCSQSWRIYVIYWIYVFTMLRHMHMQVLSTIFLLFTPYPESVAYVLYHFLVSVSFFVR